MNKNIKITYSLPNIKWKQKIYKKSNWNINTVYIQ